MSSLSSLNCSHSLPSSRKGLASWGSQHNEIFGIEFGGLRSDILGKDCKVVWSVMFLSGIFSSTTVNSFPSHTIIKLSPPSFPPSPPPKKRGGLIAESYLYRKHHIFCAWKIYLFFLLNWAKAFSWASSFWMVPSSQKYIIIRVLCPSDVLH